MMKFYKNLLICVFLMSNFRALAYEHLGEGIYIERNCDANSSQPRIAMLTAMTDPPKPIATHQYNMPKVPYRKIVQFGTKSKWIYAKKHGYDLIIASQPINECYGMPPVRELEPAWTKMGLISLFLDQYDWVFWTDADSIILNYNIKLESFLDFRFDIIGCCQDYELKHPTRHDCVELMNTGQVFFKNSSRSAEILKKAWLKQDDMTLPGYEQSRINAIIREEDLSEYVRIHNPHKFNCLPHYYKNGEFLIHLYGYKKTSLLKAFKGFEKKYKKQQMQELKKLHSVLPKPQSTKKIMTMFHGS